MRKKLALVGIGKIAQDQHKPALDNSQDWELAATVSLKGSLPGIEHFTSMDDMLAARADIEAVSLCLPPTPRFAAAAAALRAGRHVMLEKPPGATLSECRALAELAQENEVSLYASWHSREAAGVSEARAWLADKTLRRAHLNWREDVRLTHPGQDWIWEPGGFGVFDMGINALSMLTEILPQPMHLASAVLQVPSNCQMPIFASLRLAHPHGVEITADFDFFQEGEPTWDTELETTDGGTLLLEKGGSLLSINGEQRAASERLSMFAEYPRLYGNFARLVAAGSSDVDLSPLRLTADAFMFGKREIVDPFPGWLP